MSPSPTTAESTPEAKQNSEPDAKATSKAANDNGKNPDPKAQAKNDWKPDAKPKSGDDLKSIPMADLEEEAGVFSRRPQPGRGSEAADAIRTECDY